MVHMWSRREKKHQGCQGSAVRPRARHTEHADLGGREKEGAVRERERRVNGLNCNTLYRVQETWVGFNMEFSLI